MTFKIEMLPLAVNICCFGYYVWKWDEPAKTTYWMGAIILTIGLLRMRG